MSLPDFHSYTMLIDHANGDTEEVISWEDLPEIINKVLDAAVEAVENSEAEGMCRVKAREAINKLRGEG